MILSSITDILRIITSSIASLHIHVTWADMTTTTFIPGRTNTIVNTITTTTLVPAPATSTHRQIMVVVISNTSLVLSNTIKLEYYDGTTAFELFTHTVLPNDIIQYSPENGWSENTTNTSVVNVLEGISEEPALPSPSTLFLYAKRMSNKMILKIKGPSGLDSPLQVAFWQNNISMWNSTNATAGVWLGTVGAGTGTYTTALPTSTTTYTSIKRGRWANVVTTPNQVLGQRNTELMFTRGVASLQGGFFFYARGGMDVWTNGGRFFAGMATATTVISANPSALANTVGFAVDDTDNGLIYFMTRDASAVTRVSTGLTLASNKGYDCYMFCSPNGNEIGWRIVDIITMVEASGVASLTLPIASVMLTANVLASNAAIATVTAIHLGINRIYVETDY